MAWAANIQSLCIGHFDLCKTCHLQRYTAVTTGDPSHVHNVNPVTFYDDNVISLAGLCAGGNMEKLALGPFLSQFE